MSKSFENRIKNAALLKCLGELGTDSEYELKEVLRKEFSYEIEWAVYHRISDQKRTEELPDKIRRSLRHKWDGNHCPVCGNHMYFEISEKHVVEVEHIIERALGGKNESSNLISCCHNCNSALGEIFNQYVIQAREHRNISDQMWMRLIGDWVVFKQLLYWDRDLAFRLFENFHLQFNHYTSNPIKWNEKSGNFDGLIHRTKIAERFEKVIKELDKRISRKQFETQNGPSPKPRDMSASARKYRLRLRHHMRGVVS
jgi:hypothetical protein